MFTGIITEVGTIEFLRKGLNLTVLGVKTHRIYADTEISDSIAINGVCLTVTKKEKGLLFFDAIKSTLSETTLKELYFGSKLNCEAALKVGDKLGGHFVLGHCDSLGVVKRKTKKASYYELEISFQSKSRNYIVEKGSIAINGVSLTIKKVLLNSFTVDVIPFTYENTTLKKIRISETVNMECDYLLKAKK